MKAAFKIFTFIFLSSLLLFLFKCTDDRFITQPSIAADKMGWIDSDFISSSNKYVKNKAISGLDTSHNNAIKISISSGWSKDFKATISKKYGLPAWNLAHTNRGYGSVDRVTIPFFSKDDNRITAILQATFFNRNYDNPYIKFVPRNFVKNFPLKKNLNPSTINIQY